MTKNKTNSMDELTDTTLEVIHSKWVPVFPTFSAIFAHVDVTMTELWRCTCTNF